MRRSASAVIALASLALIACKRQPPAPAVPEKPLPAIGEQAPLPRRGSIGVPFTSQAPFADWGEPYQEACEEAALLMVRAFLRGENLPPEKANREILQLTSWEAEQGFGQDVTIAELAEIARQYAGLEATVLTEVTIETIEEQIAAGNPVIVPAAGRDLGNPSFSGEGPWYHMLVITGYTQTHFITNDPGTKRGEGYMYRHDILLNAIHDWTGVKEEIRNGGRRALVLQKEPRP